MCLGFLSGREFTTLRLHNVKASFLYNKEGGFLVGILDFIFPKRCVGCGRVGNYFCGRCRATIKFVRTNEAICPICQKLAIDGATHPHCQTRFTLDGLVSFFRYDGIVKKSVKAIKYRLVTDLATELINLVPATSLNNAVVAQHNNFVLVPIPLHPSRFRFRGFNQAEVLGKLLAKRLNIKLRTDLLKRIKRTVPQVEMKDRKKRLENMKDVFALNNTVAKTPENIILFDDVYTTGATLRSAANILKRAGVKNVWGMTMAR